MINRPIPPNKIKSKYFTFEFLNWSDGYTYCPQITEYFSYINFLCFLDIFVGDVGSTSDSFLLEITPANWTFFIWIVIFTWIALWFVYVLTTFCRTYDDGIKYVYQTNLMPGLIFGLFILNFLLIVGWLFAFDRQQFIVSLVIIVLIMATKIPMAAVSYIYLDRRIDMLREMKLVKDIWLVRVLLQNGLAFYSGWVFIATMLNLGIVITYNGDVSQSWSSTIVLLIVAILAPSYFILDLTIWSRYALYTVTTHLSLMWAFVGIMAKNYDIDSALRNSVLSLGILVVIIIFFVIKVGIIILSSCKKSKIIPATTKSIAVIGKSEHAEDISEKGNSRRIPITGISEHSPTQRQIFSRRLNPGLPS